MFEYWDWLHSAVPTPSSPSAPAPSPPAIGAFDEGGLGAVLPDTQLKQGAAEAVPDLSWGWAYAVAAGALALPVRSRRRGGVRVGRPVEFLPVRR